jgi:hypothetical protein
MINENLPSDDVRVAAVAILRRVGGILLFLSISMTIWNIFQYRSMHQSGGSRILQIDLFTPIAAVFLIAGNPRAGSLVRWLAALVVALIIGFTIGSLVTQPLELTAAYWRFKTLEMVVNSVIAITVLLAATWTFLQLGRPEVLQWREKNGRKRRDMRIPFAVGGIVTIAGLVMSNVLLSRFDEATAYALARKQLAPGYELHITGARVVTSAKGAPSKFYATVAAWNERELDIFQVDWQK